jgi:hypothetical protein
MVKRAYSMSAPTWLTRCSLRSVTLPSSVARTPLTARSLGPRRSTSARTPSGTRLCEIAEKLHSGDSGAVERILDAEFSVEYAFSLRRVWAVPPARAGESSGTRVSRDVPRSRRRAAARLKYVEKGVFSGQERIALRSLNPARGPVLVDPVGDDFCILGELVRTVVVQSDERARP